jgi:2-polyprenyl-3-methyl-5-hydroxy-6-metoxy-1,4-benzoquinol methylase
LLDVGCGSFPLFLTRCSFGSKYGIDRVLQNDGTHPRLNGINLIDVDLEATSSLPFADNYFDVITALAVFEHIDQERLVPLISEVVRLLKPGGQYIMTTPAPWTEGILATMAKLRLVSSAEIDEHKGAYSRSEIREVLGKAGFNSDAIRSGYFEFFMNIWVVAKRD